MKSFTASLSLLLTALVLSPASAVRAESIDFSYSWSSMPSPVYPSGTGSVTFSASAPSTASAILGSQTATYIPGAELTSTSSATSPPDSFDTPFNLKLTLKDIASGQMGQLTFTGKLAGTLTSTSSTLTSTFDNPLMQPLTLGDHIYSVTIGPMLVNVPSPGSAGALIDARITVASNVIAPPPPPPVQETPEPGTLLLGATAVLGVLARRYCKS